MKRSVRLFLSQFKISIITSRTLRAPLQTTQTAFPKPTDSPDPAIKSIICSCSLLLLPLSVYVLPFWLTLGGARPNSGITFPPPVFPFHPPCHFPQFVHILSPPSSHLEPLIVSRMGWNIPRETSGTLKSACTFTHRRNCSRKVASVQPIRQGFIGLVRAFLHMVLSCLESSWNQGSHLKENQKTRGEIIHFGHTHTHTRTLQRPAVSFVAAPVTSLSHGGSCLASSATKPSISVNSFTHLLVGPSFSCSRMLLWGWSLTEKAIISGSTVIIAGEVHPAVMMTGMSLRSPNPWPRWAKTSKCNSTEASVKACGPLTSRRHRQIWLYECIVVWVVCNWVCIWARPRSD